jgi:hypothetical protein
MRMGQLDDLATCARTLASRDADARRRGRNVAFALQGRRTRHSPREDLDFRSDEKDSVRDPTGASSVEQRESPMTTAYESVTDLAEALRGAAAAHGKHEERTGQADPDWPDSYPLYMVRERAGEELPT